MVALSQDDCPDALNKPAVDEKEVEGGNVGRSGGRNDGGMAIDKFKTTDGEIFEFYCVFIVYLIATSV